MAVDLNYWLQRFVGLDREELITWISQVTMLGFDQKKSEEFLNQKYFIRMSQDKVKRAAAAKEFEKKWGLDPVTGEVVEVKPFSPHDIMPYEDKPVKPPAQPTESAGEGLEDFESEGGEAYEEELEGEEEDFEEEAEVADKIMNPSIQSVPAAQKPEEEQDLMGFDNESLAELETMDLPPIPERVASKPPRINLRKAGVFQARDEDFVTKEVGLEEYERVLKPWKPYFDMVKEEPQLLIKLAQTIDVYKHPPYAQIRDTIVNNSIKDPAMSKVVLFTTDPERPDRLVQRFIPLTQAREVTRNIVEQGFFQAAINNYDAMNERYEQDRAALVSNIYLLEIYCETKQQSPFKFMIPKEQLSSTVVEAFKGIERLINDLVVHELSTMRVELKGEMVDVSKVVENNMGRFDTQIREAVERVIYKVKTDIEATNVEDIKHSTLSILNYRNMAYKLQSTASIAVLNVMLDDLERRYLLQDFKVDKSVEPRRYTLSEIEKKFGHPHGGWVGKSVKKLAMNKLVIIYRDSTFSLRK